MTRTRSTRAPANSRRRFLKVATLGAAAALASAALPAIAGAAGRAMPGAKGIARVRPASTRPPALEAEIEKQKKSTADLVKTIRGYPLEPGSEQAFVFAPVRVVGRRGQRAVAASTTRGGSR